MAGSHLYCPPVVSVMSISQWSMPCGGLPSIRYNELRDITAGLLSEVCHHVGIEPPLQPVTGE